ncbi:nucleotidyltransferase domain-containing protein [Clostridium senegalense]
MRKIKDFKIHNVKNIISLAMFGSYNTKYWIEGKSDIDILVLMKKREDVMDEFDLEDDLIPELEKYFQYNKIHLTFLTTRDFDSIFARQYLDSDDKLIVDELSEIDFRLYINKYLRNEKWIKKDR